MTYLPCVKYLTDGLTHSCWLAPVEAIAVDLKEPGLAHALATARTAQGTAIRLEFHKPGVTMRPALTVHIPSRGA